MFFGEVASATGSPLVGVALSAAAGKVSASSAVKSGENVYKKGNQYYSRDVDSHNGGAWKVFEANGKRLKRIGTADSNLKIFKK